MTRREDLHAELEAILGSKNVYFQPPDNYHMKYPCIVYRLENERTAYANDKHYVKHKRYEVTYITNDPTSEVCFRIHDDLEYCYWDRRFVTDNMYHNVYTVFY